jgi:heat shock protein HslJ
MHRLVIAGAAIVLLAGCALVPGAMAAALNGEWQFQAGDSQGQAIPIVAGSRITLKIDGTQAGGGSGCNTYGGTIQISGTTIQISALSMTEMDCQDDRVMASEAAYLAAVPRVTAAARDGNSLVLTGPQVELRFVLVPAVPNADLVGPVWALDSLISGETVSSTVGAEATLQLSADGAISGTTGCRSFGGHYAISGTHVQVTDLVTDKRACSSGLVEQDEHVLAVIGNGFTITISRNSLTLAAGGKGLGYRVRAGQLAIEPD